MCKNSSQSSSQITKINVPCGVACLGGFRFGVSPEVPVIWWLDIHRKIHFQGGSPVCLAVWCGLLAGSFNSLLIGISPRLLKLLTYRHLASFVMSDQKEQGRSHNALHKLASKVLYLLFHPTLCVIETWPVQMWEDTRVWITGEAGSGPSGRPHHVSVADYLLSKHNYKKFFLANILLARLPRLKILLIWKF